MSICGYLDSDVAYLLGLLVARGEILTSPTLRIVLHFPTASLSAEGVRKVYSTPEQIRLGVEQIRDRLLNLTGGDAQTVDSSGSIDLVLHFTRNTIALRNLTLLTNGRTHFTTFTIPPLLMKRDVPQEFKKEFLRGLADVAGNVRRANRDQVGMHRVRLDVLNSKENWSLPVQLCLLLQEHLGVAVPSIIWGHPNLGRHWREHQLNIYAEDFLPIGFSFAFKQQALEDLAAANRRKGRSVPHGCPGQRLIRRRKRRHPEEKNAERLPEALLGKHFNAYWQICRALGCPRRPAQRQLLPEEPE